MDIRRPTQSCVALRRQTTRSKRRIGGGCAGRDAAGGAVAALQASGRRPANRGVAVAAVAKQGSAAGSVGRAGEDFNADIGEDCRRSNSRGPRLPSKSLRLDFLYKILRRIARLPAALTVRVLEQPQHGTLAIENGQASTDFPQDDRTRRVQCARIERHARILPIQCGLPRCGLRSRSMSSRRSRRRGDAALCDRREVTAPSVAENFRPAGIVTLNAGAAARQASYPGPFTPPRHPRARLASIGPLVS